MLYPKKSRIIGILKKLQLSTTAEEYAFDYLQHLDFTSHKLLPVSLGKQSGKILQLQKRQFERSPVQDTFLILNHYLNYLTL